MAHRYAVEHAVFLSTAPAEPGDRRLAFVVVGLSLLVFLGLAPFASKPLLQVWAFIPIYESAIAIGDLITAAILLIQFDILRSRALLALGCGYLFTSLMAIAHALTFPGLFSSTGLLGAGPQSTAWLYMAWHAGLPSAVISYALLKRPDDGIRPYGEPNVRLFLLCIGVVVGAVAGLTLLATAGEPILPDLLVNGNYSPAYLVVALGISLLTVVAAFVLWLRRPHTLLDLWLMVVMGAWLLDVLLSAVINGRRFDLGFYAGRGYGLLAAAFVLVVLLRETGTLYAQLARLFEAEHRIFETSLDLIMVVDREGNVLRVSPSSAVVLDYAPAEMVGRNLADFVKSEDIDPIRAQMRRACSGHLIRNFATRYLHKNGRIVTLEWSGVWSQPEQRHLFIGRDVTEQKRIERMKDEFIATVSHELRTPVTTIAAPLGLLAGGAAGELAAPVKRLVTIAHNNSNRLTRLLNDILDLEKIESGQMRFDFQRVEVKSVLELAIEANAALAEKFGVPVRSDADMDRDMAGVAVRTDRDRLIQVLTNLLSNAVKFTLAGGEVTIGGAIHANHVRIAVRDRGPGIADEYQVLVFEKFVQVDASDARQKGGTGLGLSIVRQTMARLGGSVGHVAAPSGGTIFYVDVPLWQAGSVAGETALRAIDAA